GEVRVTGRGHGEQWNPATGAIAPLPANGKAKLRLDPYGATLLRYAKTEPARRLPATSGGLPGVALRPLPDVKPVVGAGKFVRAELSGDASRWRAVGTVTKSQVDTHLFLSFNFPQPVDLRGAEVLALDTWVPEGQTTPTELLAILHDKQGNDYIARAGRSLNAAGSCRSFVLLSQFHLAGWSKDRDARLDLSAVAAIRIGWGGYLGTAGEKVDFATAPPQLGRFAAQDDR
ncbi:MAG: hypothetical protein N2689_05300, partial [Verrucomicrobiae bacterium]|nr:hypothetical protein [Verrucomicrobiae bacterium]